MEQRFVGARLATLTDVLRGDLVARSTLLAHEFQQLGYIGRCSFDTIITGDDLAHGRIEFIECNCRWGGTSLPVTLMNRLHGDWTTQAFATTRIKAAGLSEMPSPVLLEQFHDDLFQASTGTGSLVFFTPGRMTLESAIDVLIFGESQDVVSAGRDSFTDRLRAMTSSALSDAQ